MATATVVTERPDMVSDRQLNAVEIVTMRPWKIAGIRALRVYLQALVAFLLTFGTGVGATLGITIGAGDFFTHMLPTCLSLAVAPAVVSLLQNVVELLARLDATAPQMRA